MLLTLSGLHAQDTDRTLMRRGNRLYADSLFIKAEENYLKAVDNRGLGLGEAGLLGGPHGGIVGLLASGNIAVYAYSLAERGLVLETATIEAIGMMGGDKTIER